MTDQETEQEPEEQPQWPVCPLCGQVPCVCDEDDE